MKKLISIILAAIVCVTFLNIAAFAAENSSNQLTVYVKNSAEWEKISIYAWDEHDGKATNMQWVDTPMEDLGNGWMSYTLEAYLDFYLTFCDGGEVWTNDVKVQPGRTEIYLDLSSEVSEDRNVCDYTEQRPDGTTDSTPQYVEESDEGESSGTSLTVYVKNSADWETINIYAWDEHDGASTNMQWTETPMEDIGDGWYSYTLTSYLEFYLCFQNGGEVWTNDVPVEAGVSEVYLELKNEKRGEKQLCQYTEEKPGEAAPVETDITVYVKNTAGWKIVNIYAWDDHDGASTNMEWKETHMEDIGNGWLKYTFKSYLEFYLCFQNGAEIWSNDVPVEAGVSEVYLEMKAESRGEKQLCQYTDSRPGDAVSEADVPEANAPDEATAENNVPEGSNSPTDEETSKGGSGTTVIIVIIVIVVIAVIAACLIILNKKKKS